MLFYLCVIVAKYRFFFLLKSELVNLFNFIDNYFYYYLIYVIVAHIYRIFLTQTKIRVLVLLERYYYIYFIHKLVFILHYFLINSKCKIVDN